MPLTCFLRRLRSRILTALDRHNWCKIYALCGVDEVHGFLLQGIISAVNIVAPEKKITVKNWSELYLAEDTLELMRERDDAKIRKDCNLRNKVTHLIRRDKLSSNSATLSKSGNDPRVLWRLADAALGKECPMLPAGLLNVAGSISSSKLQVAEIMNDFFVAKVDKLRASALSRPSGSKVKVKVAGFGVPLEVTTAIMTLRFWGVNTSTIRRLPSRLQRPGKIKRLSRALITRRPWAWDPVHKGKGKGHNNPSSYRTVSILPDMSRILGISVFQRHATSSKVAPKPCIY
jgi:hypothetical protein